MALVATNPPRDSSSGDEGETDAKASSRLLRMPTPPCGDVQRLGDPRHPPPIHIWGSPGQRESLRASSAFQKFADAYRPCARTAATDLLVSDDEEDDGSGVQGLVANKPHGLRPHLSVDTSPSAQTPASVTSPVQDREAGLPLTTPRANASRANTGWWTQCASSVMNHVRCLWLCDCNDDEGSETVNSSSCHGMARQQGTLCHFLAHMLFYACICIVIPARMLCHIHKCIRVFRLCSVRENRAALCWFFAINAQQAGSVEFFSIAWMTLWGFLTGLASVGGIMATPEIMFMWIVFVVMGACGMFYIMVGELQRQRGSLTLSPLQSFMSCSLAAVATCPVGLLLVMAHVTHWGPDAIVWGCAMTLCWSIGVVGFVVAHESKWDEE